MKFYFHPEAEAEFDRSVKYYEQCQPGLGLEFAEEVYATIGSYHSVSGRMVCIVQELPPLLSQ